MKESKIQTKIIKRYEEQGYYVLKLIRTNKNGIPDLLCLKSNEPPLFIEVKNETGVLSEIQKFRIKELINNKFIALILTS